MTRLHIIVFTLLVNEIVHSVANLEITNPSTETFANIISQTKGGDKFFKEYEKLAKEQVRDITPQNNAEYDFIVVGAGVSGATVASRLTEESAEKVLIIEAGTIENLIGDIPLLGMFLLFHKEIQWNYKNPPKNYCLGYKNRQCHLKTGKSMGGSSAINFMLATRGTRQDYDKWAEMTGDEGWSYTNLLKYFKKLETCDVTLAKIDPKYRNFDGPVHLTNTNFHSSLGNAFIDAGRELGYSSPIDYNGEHTAGFAYIQSNQINGERMTMNRAYLNPNRDRENLFVTMNSQATRVLIDSETKTAYGVEFMKNETTIRVIARKEIILTAGALNTPKLLILSGVGPAQDLQSLGIKVLEDLPVGENLMDHAVFPILTFLVNVTEGFIMPDLLNPTNPSISNYLTERKGLLTAPFSIEGFSFVNVDDLTPKNDDPNVEIIFLSAHLGSTLAVHQAFGIDDKFYEESFNDTLYRYGCGLWPVLMQPKSRGKITLLSTDPKAESLVDPNYFADPDDMRVMIKAVRFSIKIGETESLKRYGSTRHKYTVPGCHEYENDSDDFWACTLRTYTQTLWHYSGTCKMGREDDPSAVVNSKLQVKNIKNLRVGDASIMPMVITGHPMIPVVASAEKLADMIKSHWGYNTA